MLKIKGQKPDPLFPLVNVYALLKISCIGHEDDIVADENRLTFTRREMLRDIETLAKALMELGVRPDDVVVSATGRSLYENVLIFFAANRLGARACFFNENLAREDLVYYLKKFEAKVLFTYHWEWTDEAAIRGRVPGLEVVNMRPNHDRQNFAVSILETFSVDFGPLEEAARTRIPMIAALHNGPVPTNYFSSGKIALVSLTSGSTQGPKTLRLTNRNIVAFCMFSKEASGVKMWDKNLHTWLSYAPLEFVYGLIVSIISPLLDGGKIIFTPNFSPEMMDYYLGKNPDVIFGIPSLLEAVRKNLGEEVSLSNLKLFASGGERLEEEASRKAAKFFEERGNNHVLIANCYGTSETVGFITTVFGSTVYRPDSVGYIPAGVHVAILDPEHPETGRELGFGEEGLVCVRGQHVMEEYYKQPKMTELNYVKIDGLRYFNTGDLGVVTEDGYVRLVGRAKYYVNSFPAKVFMANVESALLQSELVKACCVVKAPDAELLYVPYAFVVLEKGVPKTDETRRRILKTAGEPFPLGEGMKTLRDYEIPRKIIFLDELPTTSTGKVRLRELEKEAEKLATETPQAEA